MGGLLASLFHPGSGNQQRLHPRVHHCGPLSLFEAGLLPLAYESKVVVGPRTDPCVDDASIHQDRSVISRHTIDRRLQEDIIVELIDSGPQRMLI